MADSTKGLTVGSNADFGLAVVALAVDAAELAPTPPWAAQQPPSNPIGVVPSLQELVCTTLARHLHQLESLDDLPDHLALLVRGTIQRDQRLLKDENIKVWLSAAVDAGTARRLNLRWASALTDEALKTLASFPSWAAALVRLDLGFCEGIGDDGIRALAPAMRGIKSLVLTGCTRCGDGSMLAIGQAMQELESLEIELLSRVTDHGLQAIVRGCSAIAELNAGGCSHLSSVSTSLIADHCASRLRRLGLGGISSLTDIDLEEISRCKSLTWLDLRACPKLSDAGLKALGQLAERQMKAHAKWEEQRRTGVGGILKNAPGSPPTLTHLDLGGLGRLSDEAVLKLATRAKHLRSLDLRGCTRLTEAGLSNLLRDGMLPQLRSLTLLSMPAAPSAQALERIQGTRPELTIVR